MSTKKPGHAGGTYYKRGSYNAWCQRHGGKVKAEDLRLEWDGLRVCKACFELRHPQDMVRGVVDLMGVPWSAPEGQDEFILNAEIQGITTAPFGAGPDNLWDHSNTLCVRVTGGLLETAASLDVLNGANLCAVQTPTGTWEVLQFVTATLTAPMTYALSELLRGRLGTETAMMSPLPAGSPFVFIGQSDQAAYDWMELYLGVNTGPYSPTAFTATADASGNVTIEWTRRSRLPRLDQDNWATPELFRAPMDCPDETYEIDILGTDASVLQTLHVTGMTAAVYPYSAILADFGSIPAALDAVGYQIDNGGVGSGRGVGRPATLAIA